MESRNAPVKVMKMKSVQDEPVRGKTAAELFLWVWDLTRNAWAFMERGNAEQRLQRHLVNLSRRKG